MGRITVAEPEALLAGLNDAQRAAVASEAQPLVIVAGAGTGKTRVLTRRIAYRVATDTAEARHVLALTFTRKAAGELRERLRALGLRDAVAAGTFHSVALGMLRHRWAERGTTPPELLDRKIGVVAQIVGRSHPGAALDVVSEIEWAKARLVSPTTYAQAAVAAGRKVAGIGPEKVAAHYARYEEVKRERRLVDFDDLLDLCRRALERDADFAAAQRWRYRHFFVDEFQDVNASQFRLLRAWLGDRPDLCVVGDPRQAIYGWNGADARYLGDPGAHLGHATVVTLEENYRSTPQVLGVANGVLAGRDPAPLRAMRADGALPVVTPYADDRAEAAGIAQAVRDHHRPGTPWGAQAVLVRTNDQAALAAEALRAAGVPTRLRNGVDLLRQPEVRAALRGLGRDGDLRRALADLAAADAEAPGGDDRNEAAGAAARRANLDALVRLGHEYLALDPAASIAGFHIWLQHAANPSADSGDAVDVTTFHAAKGLEWPVVHVAGVERGLVPIGFAITPDAKAEERRLLYVALTRAQDHLRLSWAAARTFGDKAKARTPSPYLDDVEHALAVLRGEAAPSDGRAHVQAQKAALAAAKASAKASAKATTQAALDDLDDEGRAIVERLRAWRTTQAKAAMVPPYTVFSDATMLAVAAARPRTHDALLDVHGIGPTRAVRIGEDVLRIVAEVGGTGPPPSSPAPARSSVPQRRAGDDLPSDPDDLVGEDAEAYEALREWRRGAAADQAVSAYLVFPNRTLVALAVTRPRDHTALRSIGGIGPAKVNAYGDAVLAVLAGFPDP